MSSEPGSLRTNVRATLARIDDLIASVPGRMAGIGLLLFVGTVLLLVSSIPLTFPPQLFRGINQTITFTVFAMVLVGLNMQFGDTGIANFGPVMFLAVGAYTTAIVSAVEPIYGTGFGQPWLIAVLAGAIVSSLVGGFIGLATLRLRGDYLAIVTLASAEIFRAIVRSYSEIFGGNKGISSLPNPIDQIAVNANVRFLGLALLFGSVLLVVYEGFRRLSDAPYGRVLRGILADEDALRSLGKNTFHYKMGVFVYGAAIAGLGGGLWALFQGSVSPSMASIDITVTLWLAMMLGGPGNYRAVVGGLASIMLFRLMFSQLKGVIPVTAVRFNALQPILFGILFVLAIRFRPAGLFGEAERLEVFK